MDKTSIKRDTLPPISIKRDGLPPIRFTGELIGRADNCIQHGNRANRCTKVWIYRTKGGRFVVLEEHLTAWANEYDRSTACSCETAAEAIAWLESRSGVDDGGLGRVAQEAVEAAVTNDAAFASAWVQVVE